MHLMHLLNPMSFQIRGILNKITPEKFEKLTVDILNVGLDSTIVLKGVILLVSEYVAQVVDLPFVAIKV